MLSAFLERVPARVEALGPLGPFYFFGTYVLAECLALPATPLTLSAGYLFGLPLGFAITLLAGSTAACIGFLLSRTFLQPQVARLAARNALYRKINSAVEREGFKIILLLRLSPLLPFSLSNYFFGLSRVRFPDFLGATVLGFVPGTFMYVYLANSAHSFVAGGARGPWYYYALGLAGTAVLLKFAAGVARRAVDSAVAEEGPDRPQPEGAAPGGDGGGPAAAAGGTAGA